MDSPPSSPLLGAGATGDNVTSGAVKVEGGGASVSGDGGKVTCDSGEGKNEEDAVKKKSAKRVAFASNEDLPGTGTYTIQCMYSIWFLLS